jgi:hypothetical protein
MLRKRRVRYQSQVKCQTAFIRADWRRPPRTDVELVLSGPLTWNYLGVTKRSWRPATATRTSFSTARDDTPLGRAEWIKFLATFFNEEDRANLVFSREKWAYDATKALAASAAALHELTKAKKKCAWVNDYSIRSTCPPTKTRTAYDAWHGALLRRLPPPVPPRKTYATHG